MNQEWAACVQTAALTMQRMTMGVPAWHFVQCVQHAMQSSEDEIKKLINLHSNMSYAALAFCRWEGEIEAPMPKQSVTAEIVHELQKSLEDKCVLLANANQCLAETEAELNKTRGLLKIAEASTLQGSNNLANVLKIELSEMTEKFKIAEQRLGEQRARADKAEIMFADASKVRDGNIQRAEKAEAALVKINAELEEVQKKAEAVLYALVARKK